MHNILLNRFKDRNVYVFKEEELLLGWKHNHIPNISPLRIEFFSNLLDHIEEKLKHDRKSIFILERFHISLEIMDLGRNKDFERNYSRLISRVKKLPVFILIPTLDESVIEEKSAHMERGYQWAEFLKDKLKLRGFSDIKSLYADEQRKVLKLAEEQGIPYSEVNV